MGEFSIRICTIFHKCGYRTMAGKPFKVGRFAHTLRVRLMREHIGIDVDALAEEDLMANEPPKEEHEQEPWDPDVEQVRGQEGGVTRVKKSQQKTPAGNLAEAVGTAATQGLPFASSCFRHL